MSSAEIATPTLNLAENSSTRPNVRRMAFYFESQGQSLFAWLHRPANTAEARHGVIICPPWGHEQVHSHRSLRHLADALAHANLAVLRFDYQGTGDSCGSGEESERIATALANIRDGIAWMKQKAGCQRITLVGLRLGAALAAQVAADGGIDGLVLWAPVVKGRSYVRELKALSQTAAGSSQIAVENPGGIESAGFFWATPTLDAIGGINLLQTRPQCRRALVIQRDDMPAESALVEHLKTCGLEVQQAVVPGYADMMAEPHYTKVPLDAIASAVAWTSALIDAPDQGNVVLDETRWVQATGSQVVAEKVICERVVQIHQQLPLFGILSEPEPKGLQTLPFIVLLNGGSAYRVGPNRLYVHLARQVAARGFRCLRMDISGLGDSVPPLALHDNETYPATALRDIELTFQYLRTNLGVQRIVLMGLCSGAYNAFQAAAQLTNPALTESVLINPLTYFWRDGMSLEATPAQQFQSFQESLQSASQLSKWWKLLSGQSKMGYTGAIKIIVDRLRIRSAFSRNALAGTDQAGPDDYPTHPTKEDLPGDLARVMKAKRRLTCFFARTDPGYGLLMVFAKRMANDMCRTGNMAIHFLEDADHTFTRRADRLALGQAVATHLWQRYGGD